MEWLILLFLFGVTAFTVAMYASRRTDRADSADSGPGSPGDRPGPDA